MIWNAELMLRLWWFIVFGRVDEAPRRKSDE